MADLLFEIFSEDMPARMQKRGLEDLQSLVAAKLKAAGLEFSGLEGWVTPRRLTLSVTGLPLAQPDRTEERKGPKVGAPDGAIQGFLKAAGLTSLDQAEKRDVGKGEAWFAVSRIAGRATADVLPELLIDAMMALGWPKSMRWRNSRLAWVRPLRGLIGLFDGKVLAGGLHIGINDAGGRQPGYATGPVDDEDKNFLPFADQLTGHRFMAPEPVAVTDIADYRAKLAARRVELDAGIRRRVILDGANDLAHSVGGTLVDDPGLADEVTGLVEWPMPLLGRIDPQFMDVPAEVLMTSMRSHQKYFSVRGADGGLLPYFVLVSNMVAPDGGKAIVAGNERVLRARLSDARFFWDLDLRTKLTDMAARLDARVFHAKLGTVADKVERIAALASRIAGLIGADAALAERAALLAKADLSSGMVGEFPELQGIMGRYYAKAAGEDPAVAEAIADHYAPQGPSDRCPTAPISLAVALADKLDTLAGFFAIDEKPTGSKDPFALRRAALGILRLINENGLRLTLRSLLLVALAGYGMRPQPAADGRIADEILGFLADRLKVHLREDGVRHDLIQAVFGPGTEDDFIRLRSRVDALAGFLASETGADLLAAYRRASNILRIEEKKDGAGFADPLDPALLRLPQEQALAQALGDVEAAAGAALDREDYIGAMAQFGALRQPVDAFFTDVTVNADEPALRVNRLRLLSRVRAVFSRVADFSAIEG